MNNNYVNIIAMNADDNESHPWSNNKPNGVELFVFLAYFPSQLSNKTYIDKVIAT